MMPARAIGIKTLDWHEGKFNPYGWMVEDLIKNAKAGDLKPELSKLV